MPQKEKQAWPVRFLQEERYRKSRGKEIKDAEDVNSELGRKRQEKGIRELKGLENVGVEERNVKKALYVCVIRGLISSQETVASTQPIPLLI